MIAQGEDRTSWEVSLKDGETATLIGVLADGSVAGQISGIEKGNNAGQVVIWKKDQTKRVLPWIPANDCGSVQSATSDMSRYATFTTCEDRSDNGHWVVFDHKLQVPLASRRFPRNARAVLSPDGLHYASFESGEFRIYSLPKPKKAA